MSSHRPSALRGIFGPLMARGSVTFLATASGAWGAMFRCLRRRAVAWWEPKRSRARGARGGPLNPLSGTDVSGQPGLIRSDCGRCIVRPGGDSPSRLDSELPLEQVAGGLVLLQGGPRVSLSRGSRASDQVLSAFSEGVGLLD